MQKWEYLKFYVKYNRSSDEDFQLTGKVWGYSNGAKILDDTTTSELFDYLNKLGEAGWELMNALFDTESRAEAYYFKRPKE